MDRVTSSGMVNRESEPQSGQTKDYKIGMCCFTSTKHQGERAKTGWLGIIRIMCPSWATCISADCCSSELALYTFN